MNRLLCQLVIILLSCEGIMLNTTFAQEVGANMSGPINANNFSVIKYGNWEVICEKQKNPSCVMAQVGVDAGGTPVMEIRIRKLKKVRKLNEKEIVAIVDILTPLSVMLIPGIELQIDLGPIYAAPYQLCIETGCIVREPLAKETMKAFKAGGKASITMIAAAKKEEVRAIISLNGFTKAYESL